MVHFNKLSDDLHQRLLGWTPQPVPKRVIKAAEERYQRFNLDKAKDTNPIVNLPLPEWMGTWEECVNEAVELYGRSYLDRLEKLAKMPTPQLPTSRPRSLAGWQVYQDGQWVIVDRPTDLVDCAVIDFETVEIDGYWYPFCAVLLSRTGLIYVWRADLHKGYWVHDEWVPNRDRTLDSLPTGVMWVGHNVPYDRQYISQEYQLKDTGNRFFDTMAAFIACRGLSNQQRIAYKAMSDDDCPAEWVNETATNGLNAVHQFYFGTSLDKGIRDALVDGGLPFVLDNFDALVWYCLEDVIATLNVFKSVYAELKHYQPHAASWTGQLLLGSSWLPLSSDRYPGYYERCEAAYQAEMVKITSALLKVATFVAGVPQDQIESDPWLSQLDWTMGRLELKPDILRTLIDISDESLSQFSGAIVKAKTKGSNKKYLLAPKWYRSYVKEPTIRRHCVPLFLQVRYLGQPVIWKDTGERDKRGTKVHAWSTAEEYLPHPEKKGKRVSTLFVKGYTKLWENDALKSSLEGTKDLVIALVSTINWVSFRERAKAIHTESPEGYPVVLPQLTVTGTITRRAADNVFQVLANPKEKRIGTEFKSMIEAIPGYAIVGADVASQEAWICGLFGDSYYGYNGASAFGYMNLVGTKKDRTEVHTLFADLLEMLRDDVKVVNYGVIYGMSVTGATNAIQKAVPTLTPAEAKGKAEKHIALFKGTRHPESYRWVNGLASESFNWMEKLVKGREPRSPVLGAMLSAALRTTGRDYGTTKVNWTVQTSGVDFRDLLVLLTRYFFDKLGVDGRFLMTIHDEARTMVRLEHVKMAAYALQLAHVCIRAAFIDRLGMDCIPMGIAWFPAIDVDTYLRKEPDQPCVTPSQPEALPPGYLLTPEDLLDIFE